MKPLPIGTLSSPVSASQSPPTLPPPEPPEPVMTAETTRATTVVPSMTTSELEELVKKLRTKREKPEEKQEASFEYGKFGSGNWGMMCDNNDTGAELGLYHLYTGAAATAERGQEL